MQLLDGLHNQIRFDAIATHIGQRFFIDVQFANRGELIHHQQQLVSIVGFGLPTNENKKAGILAK